jgi:hypothetical protein
MAPLEPVRVEKRVPAETPTRIDMPFRPAEPARPVQPAPRERPSVPEHVDEIGETRRSTRLARRLLRERPVVLLNRLTEAVGYLIRP